MIHTFKHWKLLEHFGNGEETFVQDLEMHGKLSNLDIWKLPTAWGDELEGATGKLTYTASIELDKTAIEDITFVIDEIAIELEIRKYRDKDDDDGELITKEIVLTRDTIKDYKVEVYNLPFYIHTLEINFGNEDLDGEVDMKNVTCQLSIGSTKND